MMGEDRKPIYNLCFLPVHMDDTLMESNELTLSALAHWRDYSIRSIEKIFCEKFPEFENEIQENITTEMLREIWDKNSFKNVLPKLKEECFLPIEQSWLETNVFTAVTEIQNNLRKIIKAEGELLQETQKDLKPPRLGGMILRNILPKLGFAGGAIQGTLMFATTQVVRTTFFGLITSTITVLNWPVIIIGTGISLGSLAYIFHSGRQIPEQVIGRIKEQYSSLYKNVFITDKKSIKNVLQQDILNVYKQLASSFEGNS